MSSAVHTVFLKDRQKARFWVLFGLATPLLYGLSAGYFILNVHTFSVFNQQWFKEWWALLSIFYILTQIMPILARPTTMEGYAISDYILSFIPLIALAVVIAVAIVWSGTPWPWNWVLNHVAWHMFLATFLTVIADTLLTWISYRLVRFIPEMVPTTG